MITITDNRPVDDGIYYSELDPGTVFVPADAPNSIPRMVVEHKGDNGRFSCITLDIFTLLENPRDYPVKVLRAELTVG